MHYLEDPLLVIRSPLLGMMAGPDPIMMAGPDPISILILVAANGYAADISSVAARL